MIEQAVTILQAGHDIRCMFATPKLLEAPARSSWNRWARRIRKAGITGIFSGGTEFTPQWNRFAHEELLDGALHDADLRQHADGSRRVSAPTGPHNNYKISYHAPQPRAVIEVVDFDDPSRVVDYGAVGTGEAHHAHERVLRARLPRTRRRRARSALRQISVGRDQRREAVPWRRGHDDRRRSADQVGEWVNWVN